MKIGPYQLPNPVLLAPMAGVTDQPFRKLCRRLGAGLVVSEMVISDSRLWNTRKSRLRLDHHGEPEPRSVQIAGGDPDMMAEAARLTVTNGAQIVDINMGCPAKKVCKKLAGSALLKDEKLVESILTAVVNAVNVPVTLKMRTGWSPEQRNGVTIARMAEDIGIQSLAVHGRTRACAYKGEVEYDTIAAIKEAVSIPVVANGDISTPEKAKEVLDHTAADGIMIGRSAQGNPWIFQEVAHYLASGERLPAPSLGEVKQVMMEHLSSLHSFYGEYLGIRIARKHLGWYVQNLPQGANFRKTFNLLDTASEQLASAQEYFEHLIEGEVMAA
ncbi:MAG: tRNA dihydrouridine synthase DusB [Ketobacteraceae bacterium]|nr:tRNA dihydrouridine synthase DusB [Ketobacteraceae bacterium]